MDIKQPSAKYIDLHSPNSPTGYAELILNGDYDNLESVGVELDYQLKNY